jgi:hypothetical protein
MSAYDYENLVNDYIKRTKRNLEVIETTEKAGEEEVYEITQYMNSLFGLLIVPYERYKDLNEYKLTNVDGYQEIVDFINGIKNKNKYYSSYDSDKKYQVTPFIRHLRNALAHSGKNQIYFLDDEGKLTGVIFYDYRVDEAKGELSEFCVELDFDSLKELIDKIDELYINLGKSASFNESYHKSIIEKQKLFDKKY